MKRILSFVMVCVSVLCLASCSWNVEPPSGTDAVTSSSGKEFFASVDKTANYEFSSEGFLESSLVSAPGMLMFEYTKRGWMICHNPQTGESRIFCSNPACNHKTLNFDCVMSQFRTSHATTYYDGYLYMMYVYPIEGEQDKYSGLVRMSLDGTEIELLYRINPDGINLVKGRDGYIYINSLREGLFRYCLETGEMERIDKETIIYSGFVLTDYGIVLHYNHEDQVCLLDYDLKERRYLFPRGAFVYQNGKFYRIKTRYKDDGKTRDKIELCEYDIETGNERYITEDSATSGFYCVADGYMYYSPKADVKLDGYLNQTGGVIYQVDIETGERKTVFKDSSLDIKNIYSMNGKMYGEIYSRNVYECGLPASLTSRARLFGEFVDRDNDGTWEFEPFVWDTSMFEF